MRALRQKVPQLLSCTLECGETWRSLATLSGDELVSCCHLVGSLPDSRTTLEPHGLLSSQHRSHTSSSHGQASPGQHPRLSSVDPKEAAKFAELSDQWWDTKGPFGPLHRMNPVRCRFISAAVATERSGALAPAGTPATAATASGPTAGRPEPCAAEPLQGLSVLDVGCGGGLLSESLARLGAHVHGVDVTHENVAAARLHAALDPLVQRRVRYEHTPMERLAEAGNQYDVVVASEVIEHVRRPDVFMSHLARLVKPDGQLVVSTLNRTLPALALAVGAAEYVLGLVPPGTHDWRKFVTPDELALMGHAAGLRMQVAAGLFLSPLTPGGLRWTLTDDLTINYIAMFNKQYVVPPDTAAGAAAAPEAS